MNLMNQCALNATRNEHFRVIITLKKGFVGERSTSPPKFLTTYSQLDRP